jgi:hypothetical protein
MKILALFDLARPAAPEESFSARALKEEDKPTEADVLLCLKRLGHEVETLARTKAMLERRRRLLAVALELTGRARTLARAAHARLARAGAARVLPRPAGTAALGKNHGPRRERLTHGFETVCEWQC